jgi:hypothetical protein
VGGELRGRLGCPLSCHSARCQLVEQGTTIRMTWRVAFSGLKPLPLWAVFRAAGSHALPRQCKRFKVSPRSCSRRMPSWPRIEKVSLTRMIVRATVEGHGFQPCQRGSSSDRLQPLRRFVERESIVCQRIRIILRRLNQPRSNRIQTDIAPMLLVVVRITDAVVRETSFPYFHSRTRFFHKSVGIAALDELHGAFRRSGWLGSEQQVDVVGH